jgi:hypothetical protein
MKRRRRKSEREAASFESFVDVVCNLIGGLLLIAIISALAVRDIVYDVFSPVEDVRTEDARSYKFAVTDKGIYPLDEQKALEDFVAESQKAPQEGSIYVHTPYCKWMLNSRLKTLKCTLKDRPPPITDMNMYTIALDKDLANHHKSDDGEYFAYFFVSPSNAAFRLFRMARKALWKEHIRVGWGPIDPRKGLTFGAGGVRLRPQD